MSRTDQRQVQRVAGYRRQAWRECRLAIWRLSRAGESEQRARRQRCLEAKFNPQRRQTFCPAPTCAPDVLDVGIFKLGANCSDAGSHSTDEDDDDADDNDKDQDNDDEDEGKAAAPSSAPEPSEATFLTLLISSYQLQRNISCLVNLLAGPPPEHPTASLGGNALCFIRLLKAIEAHTDVVFDSETLVRMKMVDHALMREISEKVTKNGTDAVKEVFCTDCHKASVNYLFGGKLKDATAAGSDAALDANEDPYDLPATSAQLTGKAAPFARRFLVQNCGEAFVDGEMPKTVEIRTGPGINDHSNGTSSAQSQAINGTKHGNGASMSVARVEGAEWRAAPLIGAVGAFVGGLLI